ncbi:MULTISPECIES: hypothetical protein [Lactobacillus]|uniref:hypothetical protein n=1 Tax=Lactobacillus TaxID=1578 RepID=UPI0018DDF8EC|nr:MULTISPECIES: hypothetical protein [Lactobacillus]MBI0033037.1 hypothetical protein [Lactobacillus sp. M0396]
MNYQDYVELGLKDDGNLKVILKGSVEISAHKAEKVGVVGVVYITQSIERARQKLEELTAKQAEGDYYMVYSCPFDTDLPALGHYPSIEITKTDLL